MATGLLTGLAGFALGRLTVDPHTAKAEVLTGTVHWTNADTRMILFEADGQVRNPLDGDTAYYVVGQWVDTAGTMHSGFPACLKSKDRSGVNTIRQRVELMVVQHDTGSRQPQNISVQLRCLG